MKTINRKGNAEGSRGSALIAACAGTCSRIAEQLGRVRESLMAEWRELLATQDRVLFLALNEAEALAWQTGVPHLVYPALAEEKVRAVARWSVRQQILNSGPRAAITA